MKIDNRDNYTQVLQLVLETGNTTRADLARMTALNKSTISYIIKEFIDEKVIIEQESNIKTGGRKGKVINFNFDNSQVLLIDIRRTTIRYFVTNLRGDILLTKKVSYDNILTQVDEILTETCKQFKKLKLAGISIHGIVTNDEQIISPFYNLNVSTLNLLFERHEIEVHLMNEANIYASGLLTTSSAKNLKTILNVHIKAGVGAGIIINNSLYTGENGYAGEVGHMIVKENGNLCGCGNRGCLETYVSEEAVEQELREILNRDFKLSDLENPQVKAVYDRNINFLAQSINNMTLLLNPEIIYICSDLYSEIPNVDVDILKLLNSSKMVLPQLKLIKPDYNLFTHGFCSIILQEQFNFENFVLKVED